MMLVMTTTTVPVMAVVRRCDHVIFGGTGPRQHDARDDDEADGMMMMMIHLWRHLPAPVEQQLSLSVKVRLFTEMNRPCELDH